MARVEEVTLAKASLAVATLVEASLAVATLLVATLLVARVEETIVETEAEVLRTPEAVIVCLRVSNRVCPRMTDNGLPGIVHPPSATPIWAVSPVRHHHPPSGFVPL